MRITAFDFWLLNLIDKHRIRLTMGLAHDLPNQETNCTMHPGHKGFDSMLIVVQYREYDRGLASRIGKLKLPHFVNPLIRIGGLLNDFAEDAASHFTGNRAIANEFKLASQVFRWLRNGSKLRVFGIESTGKHTH